LKILFGALPKNTMPNTRKSVYVIGVGMTPFIKPGGRDWDYPDMGKEAGIIRTLSELGN